MVMAMLPFEDEERRANCFLTPMQSRAESVRNALGPVSSSREVLMRPRHVNTATPQNAKVTAMRQSCALKV